MTPQLVDRLCLLVATIVPIAVVLRWNWLGVAVGTVTVWGSLAIAGFLLSALDPERDASILDGFWLLFGWLGGLLYCLAISGCKRTVVWIWRGPNPQASSFDE